MGPSVALDRLAIYDAETVPALDWLDRRELLVRVSGDDTPDAVARNIWRALPSQPQDVSVDASEAEARFATA